MIERKFYQYLMTLIGHHSLTLQKDIRFILDKTKKEMEHGNNL